MCRRRLVVLGVSFALSGCIWSIRREPSSQNAKYYTSPPHRAPIYFDDFDGNGATQAQKNNSTITTKTRAPQANASKYDVIVIGGELAGWTATYELARHHLHVLDLESTSAQPHSVNASISIADGEKIIDHPSNEIGHSQEISDVYRTLFNLSASPTGNVGLVQPKNVGRAPGAVASPIVDSFDAYYLNGVFYNHLWNDDTLKKLPAAFAVFKQELKNEFGDRMIGNLPLENSTRRHFKLELDQIDAVSWIQQMPDNLRTFDDPDSRAVYKRFHNENFIADKTDMSMKSVLTYMNLVCQARAGTDCRNLSALYVARLMLDSTGIRQPLPHVAQGLRRLQEQISRSVYVTSQSQTCVTSLTDTENADGKNKWITVNYTIHGEPYTAQAHAVIWALKLKSAPDKIEGFALAKSSATRKQVQLMRDLTYGEVMRYRLILNGRPFSSSYQTWWQSAGAPAALAGSEIDKNVRPISFFLPQFFNFSSLSPATEIVTLLEPLPIDMEPQVASGGTMLDEKTVAKLTDTAVINWTRTFQGLFYSLNTDNSQSLTSPAIRLQAVHVSRTPASVLIVGPGHFIDESRYLRRPFGQVYFASPDIGAPTFEEAVFRAHCAVRHVLQQLRPHDFSLTAPSRCPIDRE